MNLWSRDMLLLLTLIALGGLMIVLHFALCLRALRAPDVPSWLRWLAWLPVVSAVAGFRARARVLSVCWLIVACAYLVLRSLA